MKRVVFILIIALAAFGLWADGAETVIFGHNVISYETVGEVEVAITDDILNIFEDNVEDYLDDYDSVEKYLAAGCDLNEIPEDVRDYFYDILSENVDDIMDEVKDALKDSLVRGKTEYSYMNIGPYQFSASMDFPL